MRIIQKAKSLKTVKKQTHCTASFGPRFFRRLRSSTQVFASYTSVLLGFIYYIILQYIATYLPIESYSTQSLTICIHLWYQITKQF